MSSNPVGAGRIVVNPVLLAAPVALVPAVGALWYLLKRYEAYFEDSRVFLSLTFGFFLGLLAAFLERQLFRFEDPQFGAAVGIGTAFLLFVIGYAFFETALKLVVLGTKRFRGRKDTPYYGAALGLGMGTMMSLGFIALNFVAAQAQEAAINQTANGTVTTGPILGYQWLPFLAMIAVPIGATFAHGGVGVYVGRSIAKGDLWRGWVIGALLQMPVLGAYWLFYPSVGFGFAFDPLPGVISLAYGGGLLWIARARILDTIVPKEILDKLRRAERREARRAARDEEE